MTSKLEDLERRLNELQGKYACTQDELGRVEALVRNSSNGEGQHAKETLDALSEVMQELESQGLTIRRIETLLLAHDRAVSKSFLKNISIVAAAFIVSTVLASSLNIFLTRGLAGQ